LQKESLDVLALNRWTPRLRGVVGVTLNFERCRIGNRLLLLNNLPT